MCQSFQNFNIPPGGGGDLPRTCDCVQGPRGGAFEMVLSLNSRGDFSWVLAVHEVFKDRISPLGANGSLKRGFKRFSRVINIFLSLEHEQWFTEAKNLSSRKGIWAFEHWGLSIWTAVWPRAAGGRTEQSCPREDVEVLSWPSHKFFDVVVLHYLVFFCFAFYEILNHTYFTRRSNQPVTRLKDV